MLTGYYLAKKRLGARDRKFLVGAAVDASLTFLRACIVPTTICVSGIWARAKKSHDIYVRGEEKKTRS